MDIESASSEGNGNFDRSWRDEPWNLASGERKLSVAAQEVYLDEKDMSIWSAIKISKKGILWSLVISTCVIMEGYDTNLLGTSMLTLPSNENTAAMLAKLSKPHLATVSPLAGNLGLVKEVAVDPLSGLSLTAVSAPSNTDPA